MKLGFLFGVVAIPLAALGVGTLFPVIFDLYNWIAGVCFLIGFIYQGMDGLFFYTIESSQTTHGKELWAKMEADKEMWTMKMNLWIVMGFTAAAALLQSAVLSVFFGLAITVTMVFYIDYCTKYNDDIEDTDAF